MNAKAAGSQPSVAVCIPAYGSPAALAVLLASLKELDHPPACVQVVVCIDGPDDALEAIARESGATTVVLATNQGSYAARNAALDAVRPDVTAVLFTDTDCTVTPAWVTNHLLALSGAAASGGGVRVTTSEPPLPAEWVDASRHLRQQHFVEGLGFAATCNLAVRRDVVDVLRFDSSLRSGGDYDFGQRLAASGHALVFSPNALVHHPARRTMRQTLAKVSRVARGAAVNQARGHTASERRDPTRGSSLRRAERESLATTRVWRAKVRALDLGCSLVYARHVPSVVSPALRRRLRGLA